MAGKVRARLIYSTVSTSERISNLGFKGALLFTWFLAHCDDQGRYCGTSRKVKYEVVPLFDDITVEDVETSLKAMDEADLIIRYSEFRRDYIQVTDWWEFNAKLRYTAKSRHPPPENWIDRVTRRDEFGKFIGGRRSDQQTDLFTDRITGEEDYEEYGNEGKDDEV